MSEARQPLAERTGMDSNQIDVVENGAIVKVFLLEGPFPWNTPTAILDGAGNFWESFGELSSSLNIISCSVARLSCRLDLPGSVVLLLISVDSAFRLVSSDCNSTSSFPWVGGIVKLQSAEVALFCGESCCCL